YRQNPRRARLLYTERSSFLPGVYPGAPPGCSGHARGTRSLGGRVVDSGTRFCPMPAPLLPPSPPPASAVDPWRLDCRGRVLACRPGRAAHGMGILSVTPDSFSDGGRYASRDAALRRAEQMVEEGAAILDVGGESTRPAGRAYGEGAAVVSPDEEMRRVLPVIEAIAQHFPHVLISIDTYKGEVARAALRAGAHLVNDVGGVRHGVGTAR